VKVLLGCHGFPPRQSAGAEQQAYRIARWLAGHGHTARVVAIDRVEPGPESEIYLTDDRVDGIPVRRLSYRLEQRAGATAEFDNPLAERALGGVLAAERPDVFHLISGYRLTGRAILAARAHGLPVVVSLMDFWFLCPRIILRRSTGELCSVPDDPLDCALCLLNEKRRYRLAHRLTGGRSAGWLKGLWRSIGFAGFAHARRLQQTMVARRAFQAQALAEANCLISSSAFLAGMFEAQGVSPERIAVIRQGLDLAPPADGAARRPGRPLTFGYVGQIAEHKGLALLVRAFRRLPAGPDRARLVIHGDPATAWPPFWRMLQGEVGGDPSITLAGPFAAAEAGRVYGALDALVVPSVWYENSPNVILEAFACGLPVVASDLGGMTELVAHERTGLLFPPGDEGALARALGRVLEQPQLLERWRAAIPPVKTLDQEMAELVGVYERVARV
jgi:glycosyltransferase involved in cell wall biosynthesis